MTAAAGTPDTGTHTALQQFVLDALQSRCIPEQLVETVVNAWLAQRKKELLAIGNVTRQLRNRLDRGMSVRHARAMLDASTAQFTMSAWRLLREVPKLHALFTCHSSMDDTVFEAAVRELAGILPH